MFLIMFLIKPLNWQNEWIQARWKNRTTEYINTFYHHLNYFDRYHQSFKSSVWCRYSRLVPTVWNENYSPDRRKNSCLGLLTCCSVKQHLSARGSPCWSIGFILGWYENKNHFSRILQTYTCKTINLVCNLWFLVYSFIDVYFIVGVYVDMHFVAVQWVATGGKLGCRTTRI